MLLVDRLPRDSEGTCDRLPRPPDGAGVVDMQVFELLDQSAQSGNRGEPNGWVSARYRLVEAGQVLHHRVSLS